MTDNDKILNAEEVELVVSGDEAHEITEARVEDVSIGFDSGDRDVEGVAVGAAQTEYSGTIVFEPSPQFLLWWLAILKAREGEVSCD